MIMKLQRKVCSLKRKRYINLRALRHSTNLQMQKYAKKNYNIIAHTNVSISKCVMKIYCFLVNCSYVQESI